MVHAMEQENKSFFIPCGDYTHHEPVKSIIHSHKITTAFPYCTVAKNATIVPENCISVVPDQAVSFPFNPCQAIVATNFFDADDATEKDEGKHTTVFAHVTHRTKQQAINNWLHRFFRYTDPERVCVTLYSNINSNTDPKYYELHKKKSQINRIIERADRIKAGLGIPTENIHVDLVANNRDADYQRILADCLDLDQSQISVNNGIPDVYAPITKVEFDSADDKAFDISCANVCLAVNTQGEIFNTLLSAVQKHTQQSILQDYAGKDTPVYYKKKNKIIHNIRGDHLSKIISDQHEIPWKEESAPLYKVTRYISPTKDNK